MNMTDAIIELKKHPVPYQIRIIANSLEGVLHEIVGSTVAYTTVLGAATLLVELAGDLEEKD